MSASSFHRPTVIFAVALTAAVAIPAGVAHANTFTADANCDGLTFSLPRGEEGTTVTATVDGRRVAISTVATHGDPVGFTVANPDPTSTHTWAVTVDSRFNPDQTWTETVGPCVTPTTVIVPTTTTVTPTTSTTVGTTPTTVPATTTVVTVPRPTPTTTTTVPVGPYRLPDTGNTNTLALYAAATIAFGAVALTLKNWRRK